MMKFKIGSIRSRRSIIDPEKTSSTDEHNTGTEETGTEVTATAGQAPLPPPTLTIKKVDHYFSRWSKKWKYQNTSSNVIPELRALPSDGKDDPWREFCFVIVREIPNDDMTPPYFKFVVKSSYLLKACKEVIAEVQGVSWNSVPLELDPKILIAFLPDFEKYREALAMKSKPTEEERYLVSTVDVLLEYFRKDYRSTLASIQNLTRHGEITFDLLYAVLIPRTVVLTQNALTGELQALQLTSATLTVPGIGTPFYDIILEGIDVDDSDVLHINGFTPIQTRVVIPKFKGTVKITSLEIYPIQYHPQQAEVREKLLARGKKWVEIAGGIHHMYYQGTGGLKGANNKLIKYNLNGRVMVDRANFRKLNPNYSFPPKKAAIPSPDNSEQELWAGKRMKNSFAKRPPFVTATHRRQVAEQERARREQVLNGIPLQGEARATQNVTELSEHELLITSPIVYAFSLADKLWLELDVAKITDVEWNEDAFANLVLPQDRKVLLQSLVEAHNDELGFDDFIKGKGRGLVVNLFGPPGVGKTLSAEATSEHVRRPLYVVGAGDLGTTASQLDNELQRVFELATAWRAIVLIDEADVFLEQRSLHDLERNAMVSVFLRHLEYYPAILFLTTNRVKTFDEAFLSRIHIALHFHGLSQDARLSVWQAFLIKAGVSVGEGDGISEEEMASLITRNINGRQVKNAVKTATSLAHSRKEKLCYRHLKEVLDVMEKFANEFAAMKAL